jgi:hypothetical protein
MMEQPPAPRRAVILGASNVARGIATAVATAEAAWGQPLDLLIAAGHGRSYGMWNWVLGYSVPGIARCGLWEALDEDDAPPTAALITDIGNDLLYGASPAAILEWVEACLLRLAPRCDRLVMSELPLASVARLRPAQYYMLRSILFPPSRLAWDAMLHQANCLNEGIIDLSKKFFAARIAIDPAWYGFDPIHVRRRHIAAAWRTLLQPWCAERLLEPSPGAMALWWRLHLRRAHVQRFLRRETHTPQPVLRLPSGTRVSLY